MPKYLITRCTTVDMAGQAMINGFINGMNSLGGHNEYGALVFAKDYREQDPDEDPFLRQFIYGSEKEIAVKWADCCVDIGGLCKGMDAFRAELIAMCRGMDKPYVYGCVSFQEPDESIVQDVPAVARGGNSAISYFNATDKWPVVAPDLSFMIDPARVDFEAPVTAFTTHTGKPWEEFVPEVGRALRPLQVVFKPSLDWRYEPRLDIQGVTGTPEELYGCIAQASRVFTCRYHAAVAAIMAGVEYHLPADMPNMPKYDDLARWQGVPVDTICKEAIETCRFVKEVLYG